MLPDIISYIFNLILTLARSGTSGTGAIHRAWIDVKATFSGHDRKSVLAECERGEDAIKKRTKMR